MLTNTKAVIFDLDGTLVDSMWVWKQVDIDYLGARGLSVPKNLQKDIEGCSMKETAEIFQTRLGITDSIAAMMDEWNHMAWEAYAKRVPYKKGAEDFLRLLRQKGIKTGIATSNSKELLKGVADALGMERYIDCFLSGNDVKRGKPAPDIYLEVASRLQVSPSECLVFEDICPGIEAGHNAGMRVCAVDDPYSSDITEQKKALAEYFISDYTELLDL